MSSKKRKKFFEKDEIEQVPEPIFKAEDLVSLDGKPACVLRSRHRETGYEYLIAFSDGSGIKIATERDLKVAQ